MQPAPEGAGNRRAVFLLSLAAFASAASLRATDPLLSPIASEFGVTVGAAGSVITGFALSYGVFQLAHGPIGDRYGKFRVIMLTTGLSAFATLACALASSLLALTMLRFLAGVTVGAIIPLAMAWIGDTVVYEQRQATIARFLIGQMLGAAAGVSLSGMLGAWLGWRAIFVVLALIFVATALLLGREMRRDPRLGGGGNAALSLAQALRRMAMLVRRPWARVILVVVAIECAFTMGVFAFVAWDLQHRHGVALALSGLWIVAYPVGALVYASCATRLIARLGEQGLALVGGFTLGAGFLCLLLAPLALAMLPGLFAIGIGFAMLHNTLQVNATQMAPEARGAAVSLFAFCLFTSQSAGIALAGRVIDRFGIEPVYLAVAVAMPLLAIAFARRRRRRPQQTAA
jgi:MFS transporter, YNFM family, putative membrane transport protein